MTLFRVGPAGGGGGIPSALKNAMNAVFNKKFETSSVDYPPEKWPEDVNLMGPLPLGSASGAIAHFEDGADTVPIKSWGVTLPASLSGYSSVDAVQTGKNLLNYSVYKRSSYPSYDANYVLHVKSGTTYTFSCASVTNATSWRFAIRLYDSDHNVLYTGSDLTSSLLNPNQSRRYYVETANRTTLSFSFTMNVTCYATIFVLLGDTQDDTVATSAMLEVGSSATAYSAYEAPTQYTASLGRTIYGGSVDVVQGTGTDGYSCVVSLNSLTWNKTTLGGNDCFYATLPNGYIGDGSGRVGGDCDDYTITTDGNMGTDETIRFYFNSNFNFSRVSIRDDQYASYTGAQFKEAVTGNIVYQLAESARTDFSFSPISVNSRYGVNNLWTDNGSDNQVAYRADIGLALGYNKYRYLKWTIKATRTTSSYVQMSEISFTDANDAAFTFPTGTTVTATATATSGTSPAYIIDGNTNTKYCGNWSSSGVSLNIDLGFGNTIDVSKYIKFNWYTANDATDRDPYTWELYGINNAGTEILLCSRTAYTPTSDRKALADTVSINQVS